MAMRFCEDELPENNDIHLAPALFLLFRYSSRSIDRFEPPAFVGKIENADEHMLLLREQILEGRNYYPEKSLKALTQHVDRKRKKAHYGLTTETLRCLCRALCLDFKCLEYEMPEACENITC